MNELPSTETFNKTFVVIDVVIVTLVAIVITLLAKIERNTRKPRDPEKHHGRPPQNFGRP